MRTRFLAACAAAFLSAGAVGCETRSLGFATTGPGVGSARVRLFNAVTSAQSLDLLIDGTAVATAIPLGGASRYAAVALGAHRLQVRTTGTSTFLIDFTRDLTTQGSFTLVPAPGLGESGALFFADDPAPVTGRARLRVVNTSPASGTVSVFLTTPGGPLDGAEPVAGLLDVGGVSDYITVEPGQYQVRVTRAGTVGDVLLDTGAITFGAGAVRTLFLTDAPSGGAPPSLSVVSDAN